LSVVDLHVHSTASDGTASPRAVVQRAAAVGLSAIALTDHDTVDGVEEALAASRELSMRVVAGCEFSVAARWGEMHLLGYFLPADAPQLNRFLEEQREKRRVRAVEIVTRLTRSGIAVTVEQVLEQADGGAVGRPHVARVLVARGVVPNISVAFTKYLGRGRPAFVPKELPSVVQVTRLVRRVGGLTSAAHLKDRAVRPVLRELKGQGVDAVEAVHPAHDQLTMNRIVELANDIDMLVTGGSDWHGDATAEERAALGALDVPIAWLQRMEESRGANSEVGSWGQPGHEPLPLAGNIRSQGAGPPLSVRLLAILP
jgi:predicted metal-dependent phosphoesterase TrpH